METWPTKKGLRWDYLHYHFLTLLIFHLLDPIVSSFMFQFFTHPFAVNAISRLCAAVVGSDVLQVQRLQQFAFAAGKGQKMNFRHTARRPTSQGYGTRMGEVRVQVEGIILK